METDRQPRSLGLCAVLVALAVAAPAAAREDAVLAVAYGNGVHAYHAGDYQRSHDALTAAIDGGTLDPRAYYFRGLAALRLGRLDEAEADFRIGADHEAAGHGNWPVARSLERIQGEPRLLLERYRVRARMAAMEQRRQAIVRRYSEVEAAQPDVQRTRRPENVRAVPSARQPQLADTVGPPEPEADEKDAPTEREADEAPMKKDGGGTKPDPDDPFAN